MYSEFNPVLMEDKPDWTPNNPSCVIMYSVTELPTHTVLVITEIRPK